MKGTENSENKKSGKSVGWYRNTIFLYQFVLTFIPVLMVSILATYIYVTKNLEKNRISTESEAAQFRNNVDEVLSQLQGYFTGAAEDERIKWFLDNDVFYSDYSKLIDVQEVLCGKYVFSDYIKGYTIINFRTGWVLSNRGMHPYSSVANQEAVELLYQEKEGEYSQWYWLYSQGTGAEELSPREYVDYEELCFVIRLPAIGKNHHAMIIARIAYENLITNVVRGFSDFEGTVISGDGKIMYTTDYDLAQYCASHDVNQETVLLDGEKTYVVRLSSGVIPGMKYYVARNNKEIWGEIDGIWVGALAILAVALGLFAVIVWSSNKLYQPVAELREHVGSIAGDTQEETTAGREREKSDSHWQNELESIAKQINALVNDKENAEAQSLSHRQQFMKIFTLALLSGEVKEDSIADNIAHSGFAEKRFYMVITAVPQRRDGTAVEEKELEKLKGKLEQLPREIEELLYLPMVFYSGVFVFTCASDGEVMLNMKAQRLCDSLELYIGNGRSAEQAAVLFMGVSCRKEALSGFRKAYKEGRKAVETRRNLSERIIFCTEETGQPKNHYFYNTNLEKKIKTAVENCDMETAGSLMDQFVEDMFRNGAGNDNYVYVYRMIMTIMLVPSELGLGSTLDGRDSDIFSYASQIYDADRLKTYLRVNVLEPVILMIDEARDNRAEEIMEQIKRVVEEHEGDITLAECAELLNYHPNYLWKVIKSERNTTFTDYIAEYKFEKAKELLVESGMSVAEIAEKLKYTNAQNFIRFFSKMAGVTPGKYRQEFKK